MTLRHAAALALVGWYLMVPPATPDWRDADPKAPLSEWLTDGSYDNVNDCNEAIVRLYEQAPIPKPETMSYGLWVQNRQAVCVATDDPRLKGK